MIESKIERGILDFGITMGQYDTTQNFNSLTLPENNEYGVIVSKEYIHLNRRTLFLKIFKNIHSLSLSIQQILITLETGVLILKN